MPRKKAAPVPPGPVTLCGDGSITRGFRVSYECNVEDASPTGNIVGDCSLYNALRELSGPFTEVDDTFVETDFHHLPTHAGKLTQKRTLHLPAGISQGSRARLRRYLLRVPV